MNGALVEGYLYDGQLRPVGWLDDPGAVKATFGEGAGGFRRGTEEQGSSGAPLLVLFYAVDPRHSSPRDFADDGGSYAGPVTRAPKLLLETIFLFTLEGFPVFPLPGPVPTLPPIWIPIPAL